jgi:glycosyltransferase involved in cell wall biosynthesis
MVVGNWDHSRYGRQLKAQYGRSPHTILADPIYDQKKLNSLRSNCALYVHGHSAGGTNPSLIEAMQLGRAVVAFDVNYNRVTTEGRASFFRTHDDLAAIVRRLTPLELREMGAALEQVASRRYTWSRIARAYATLFGARRCERSRPGEPDAEALAPRGGSRQAAPR